MNCVGVALWVLGRADFLNMINVGSNFHTCAVCYQSVFELGLLYTQVGHNVKIRGISFFFSFFL